MSQTGSSGKATFRDPTFFGGYSAPFFDGLLLFSIDILLELLGPFQVLDALGPDGGLGFVRLGLVLHGVEKVLDAVLIKSERLLIVLVLVLLRGLGYEVDGLLEGVARHLDRAGSPSLRG